MRTASNSRTKAAAAASNWRTTIGLAALVLAALACGSDDEVGDGSFGSACSTDADCDSNKCFEYGEKGKRCTLPCPADPAECPNDGQGCNNQGVCKVP